MNYWIALSIMLGWFPVFQTVLHLEERDKELARRRGKQNRPVIRDRNNNRAAFRKELAPKPTLSDIDWMSDDEWLNTNAADTFCE